MSGKLGLLHFDGDIGAGLASEPFFNLAGGDKLALLADQRPVVDADLHRDGRGINVDKGERLTGITVGDCFPDVDFLETADSDDVPGAGLLKLDLLESLVAEDRGDRLLFFLAVFVDGYNLLPHLYLAADDAPEGDAP